MTSRIGVRDLKNRASELVREVHERDAEFIVTLRGQPVAVLKPLSDRNEREVKRAERDETLSKLDELAEQIARSWRSPKSATRLVEEQRR